MSDYYRQQVAEWVRRVASWGKDRQEAGVACGPERIYNAQGDYVEGYTITSLYKPRELMALNAEQRALLFDSYFGKINDLQLDYVGLGAYTSVISRSGLELLDRGVNITTGNSLTAMSCVEALREVAAQTDRPLSQRCLAIAGAYGSIGRLVALELSGEAKQLVLIGNPLSPQAMESLRTTAGEVYRHVLLGASPSAPVKARLNAVCGINLENTESMENGELYDFISAQFEQAGQPAPIDIDIRLEPWLERVDAVLTATSAGRGFIDLSRCLPGTIICDAAQPPDLARQNNCRSDLVVFSGGELMLPHSGFRFGNQNLTGLECGTTLACMGETMVLTMSSIRSHQSVGPNPCIQKARQISQLARQFGFRPRVPELSLDSQKAMASLTVA